MRTPPDSQVGRAVLSVPHDTVLNRGHFRYWRARTDETGHWQAVVKLAAQT